MTVAAIWSQVLLPWYRRKLKTVSTKWYAQVQTKSSHWNTFRMMLQKQEVTESVMMLQNVIDRDERSFKRLRWGKGSIFPLTNLLSQSFRDSQTWLWCLHTTEKLQCKRAVTPCPPLSRDLQFCTNNTTVLLAHASPSVHLSTETLHRALCRGGVGTGQVWGGNREGRMPPPSPVLH